MADTTDLLAPRDPGTKTIIIADDDDQVARTMQEIIHGWWDRPVTMVANGEELSAALTSGVFRAVVTDMNMPGVSGTPLVQRIRAEHPDIGIIVMTGYVDEFPYLDVIKAGADDFIRKPFQREELRAKLERLFREQDLRHRQHRAEQKYRSLFQMSHEGMLVLDADYYQIEDANPAFAGLCGTPVEQLAGSSFLQLFSERDQLRLQAWLGACAHIGRGTLADVVLSRNEVKTHADISATFITAGGDRLIYCTFKDVTERREVEGRLADAAQKDELTGLYNKRSFHNRLEGAVQRAARTEDAHLALLMVDLDNFKRCNDTHGHQIGDKLLRNVGAAIHASIRKSDLGFRCGGDEFCVLLIGSEADAAMRVAGRMQEEFASFESYGTTMSIGVAVFDKARDNSPESLIKRSDEALYRAKGAGKNAVELAQ